MGFYIRKSVSVGPFRFNLSKSGVGVSVGVKGFRVGSGPRGNYVRMGLGGVSYRATLSEGAGPPREKPTKRPLLTPSADEVALTEIESATSTSIVDSSSAELVAELNAKKRKARVTPFVAIVGLFIAGYLNTAAPPWAALVTIGITAVGSLAALRWDQLRKTTVLLYELDEETEHRFQRLHDAFNELSSCRGRWHISAKGNVHDRKYHAGASTLLERTAIRISAGSPPFVKSNVSVPILPVGKQLLYFFPDKVLVFEPGGVGAVSYTHLNINESQSRFIENSGVPSDAQVVGTTWRYVNKKGGPDKRFKNNRQLPIALYEELRFSSETGLHEVIQVSRTGVGGAIVDAVRSLSEIAG